MTSKNIYTLLNPKSLQSEAYRIFRTNLQFASVGEDLKILAITSATSGEGKTTTAINISVTLSQLGKKVLLIDCDLRKSMIHKYLQISNNRGLTLALSGMIPFNDAIIKTEINGLEVVTAGLKPPNPSELFNSNRMRNLLEDLKSDYDYIILDCPPVIAVTDGAILANIADGTVLVVSSGVTSIDSARKAKEHLVKVKANILGVVLNNIKIKKQNYYYYDYEGDYKDNKKKSKGRK